MRASPAPMPCACNGLRSRQHEGPTRSPEIRRLVHEASLLGFRVEFVEFMATASFPMATPPE